MYNNHQTSFKGNMSFIESLLPESVKVQHIDSYNTENSKRFQGSFFYDFNGVQVSCNECPLDILKAAIRYQFHICTQCGTNPHIVWTIWFN